MNKVHEYNLMLKRNEFYKLEMKCLMKGKKLSDLNSRECGDYAFLSKKIYNTDQSNRFKQTDKQIESIKNMNKKIEQNKLDEIVKEEKRKIKEADEELEANRYSIIESGDENSGDEEISGDEISE